MKNESLFQFLSPDQSTAVPLDTGVMLAALTQAGYSNTRARRAVLEALVSSGGRATPAQLLATGRHYHPELGLVTVYRTIDVLVGLGLVRKLHLEEGCHAYALSPAGVQAAAQAGEADEPAGRNGDADRDEREREAGHAHAHHIICERCHRAVEFDGCDIAAVVASVEAQTGFEVRAHWLEMFGLCPACQRAAEEVA